ncbi:MAG: OmpA family protein [Devosia sp.]|uniref:OmpA family protein n=1 Tax=Devosia sp. TaxID=1871048 RepID=UPI0024CBE2A9|nr:OmpA family protein [Devosia sp.]UYN99935.1 MAG: OmpA family protein [Devosia sp.]
MGKARLCRAFSFVQLPGRGHFCLLRRANHLPCRQRRLSNGFGMKKNLLVQAVPGLAIVLGCSMSVLAMAAPAASVDVAPGQFAGGGQIGSPSNDQFARDLPLLLAQSSTPSTSGSVISLASPQIADYWVTVSRQDSGVLVFDGYVPDEQTRQALAKIAGADASYLKLGRGAPANYRAAVDFGVTLLARVSEGRFSLRGGAMSLEGTARTSADYAALTADLETGAPVELELATLDVKAPAVSPYRFGIEKTETGEARLRGILPTPQIENQLLALAGGNAVSNVGYASGEAPNFVASAEQAVQFLPHLASGMVRFDGQSWSVSGQPTSEAGKAAIETEFAIQQLAQAGWTLDLAPVVPAAPEPSSAENDQAPATAESAATGSGPYTWSLARSADGAVTVSGFIPAETLGRFLDVRLAGQGPVVNTMQVADGAPEGFSRDVLIALDMLDLLGSAQIDFDGQGWRVTGQAAEDTFESDAALVLGDQAANWQIAVEPVAVAQSMVEESEPEIAEAVTPTAEVEPAAASTPVVETATAPAAENPAAIEQCRAELAELTSHNAILFQSGAAIIADSARSELDSFAATLSLCPEAPVYVEGHTDSDGEATANLVLSVSRAESVVQALIERGVDAARLYAIGYGESQPVADNATSEGKRSNRRIVISIPDQPE